MVPTRRPHRVRPYFQPFRIRLSVERLEDRCVFAAGGTNPAPLLTQFGSAAEFRDFYLDIDAAVEQYKDLLGTTTTQYYGNNWWGCDIGFIRGIGEEMILGLPAFAALSAGEAATSTNVQEEGVDEADLVKTDGEFIYLIRNGELVIVDARARRDLDIASQTDIEGSPLAQYLIGDRLTVISQDGWGGYNYDGRGIFGLMTSACWAPGGYDPKVKVTVFDVSDAYAPEIVEETYLDGSYANSRAIGDHVYLVVQNYLDPLPAPLVTYTQLEDGYAYTYETEADYRQRVSNAIEGLPWFWSVDVDGTVQNSRPVSEADTIYRPDSPDDRNLVSVVAFDLGDDATGPADSVTLATSSATIYASTSHLYLIGQQDSYDPSSGYQLSSIIHKVGLQGSDVELAATGQVDGRVLNQFSMDEENGYFRIATTTDGWWSGGGSNVYILAEEGDALNVVGALENLAPGETLYSASFFDDVGFLVTFVEIDPLFALDLSDPTNPRVMGELKIPGYSDYLQPIDEHHLLAIGRDTEVASWGGVLPDELQVSLFDVSDLTNPILLDRYSFEGGRNGSSIAGGLGGWGGNDHHAFTFDAGHGILAIPFALWSGSHLVEDTNGDGTLDAWVSDTSHQLRLFQVDQAKGIDVLGSIAHDSPVLRSFVIDKRLFSLSQDSIKVHALKNLDEPLAELDLPETDLVASSTGESFLDLPRDRVGEPPAEEEPPADEIEETPIPDVEEVPIPVVEETPAPDDPPVIVEEPEPAPDDPPLVVVTQSTAAPDAEPSALALPVLFPSEGIELGISTDTAEPISSPTEPSAEATPASVESDSGASQQLMTQLAEPDGEEATDDLFASWEDDELQLEPLFLS